MYMVFGHDGSLVSFGDRDLIFTVTMRHKLKYLSKIMTYSVCTKPIEPDGEFIWIYTSIYYGQDNGDLDLFASVTTRCKCQMQTCVLNCSTITGVAAYDL